MDSIIEKLFNLHIESEEYFSTMMVEKEDLQKECALYGVLYDSLSSETLSHLREYLNLLEMRTKREKQALYEIGFKTAIRIVLESTKE